MTNTNLKLVGQDDEAGKSRHPLPDDRPKLAQERRLFEEISAFRDAMRRVHDAAEERAFMMLCGSN